MTMGPGSWRLYPTRPRMVASVIRDVVAGGALMAGAVGACVVHQPIVALGLVYGALNCWQMASSAAVMYEYEEAIERADVQVHEAIGTAKDALDLVRRAREGKE